MSSGDNKINTTTNEINTKGKQKNTKEYLNEIDEDERGTTERKKKKRECVVCTVVDQKMRLQSVLGSDHKYLKS